MVALLAGLFALDVWMYRRSGSGESVPGIQMWLGDGLVVAVLAALAAVLGALEVTVLARHGGAHPLVPATVIGAVLLAVQSFLGFTFSRFEALLDPPILLSVLFFILVLGQMLRRQTAGAAGNLAWSVLALVYIGLLLSFLVRTRVVFGPGPVILLIVAVKGSDIGAYFSGLLFGRHKLIPWLSPGKTVEGLVGAVLFSVVLTLIVGSLSIITHGTVLALLDRTYLIVFGIMFALVGHVGDLTESLLKRSAGVKDSGHLLPEFGGALDMIDSLLPTGFIWYMALKYIS